MNRIGRKLYFDKETGHVILDTGERKGSVIETSVEQDIETYQVLGERNRGSFDVISFQFGAFALEFANCKGFYVDVITKSVKFI
ncbi:hypothetical protein [Bacillus sp. NTK034]|uniref:hypothetical protein n=1 Tax=Bacillus sp. NTK034 TaxID=2802176 RepID=UPI001A8F2792|nr:hypothetical protein [Bacillus sp. NTK034]MBN8200475.1 hypothetical protein [Bacillus sp. NTK034]